MIESAQAKLLLVDDDPLVLRTLKMSFQNHYEIKTATSVPLAKAVLNNNLIDLIVTDLNFEAQAEDGLVLMDWISMNFHEIPIVVFSNDKKTKRIVQATQRRHTQFIAKDDDTEIDLQNAIETGLIQKKLQASHKNGAFDFLTASPKMKKVLMEVDKISARGQSPSILITGESGTGKEYMAKTIASRSKKTLITANMAAIPKDMAESELFGHCKGAFTGALTDKVGLIEHAHNGIFFLDEIGDCSLDLQAKLLRVIQEGEVRRLGDSKPRKVSVQFISATNKNIPRMILLDEFREDLYYRLNTFEVHIPPLRQRPEDVQLYLTKYIQEFSDGHPFPIRAQALPLLLSYGWPGNVRELSHFAQKVVTLCEKQELDEEAVLNYLLKKTETLDFDSSDDRSKLIHALEQSKGNRTHAAKILGKNPSTVHRQIKHYGISIPSRMEALPETTQKNVLS
ncbi:MAG: sigma-54-dependent transcriptional regulator [Bdellovibrionia bacterium]